MKKTIALIIIMIISVTVFSGCDSSKEEIREIRGLKLSQNIASQSNGTFILGMGVYSDKNVIKTDYYLYIKGEEGFKLQHISSDNLEIVEVDNGKYGIKGYFDGNSINEYGDYIVYVPKGTIYTEYNVKLP